MALLLWTVLMLLAWLLCIRRGRRQQREAGETRGRLALMALAAALLATSPMLLAILWGASDHGFWGAARVIEGIDEHGEPLVRALDWREPVPRPDLLVALIATLLACRWALAFMSPVGRALTRGGDLPPLDEPEALATIARLAERIGIRPPRVLRLGHLAPSLPTWACAGGLVAPTLIVTDGILHRIDPAERDAVLVHELTHVARRDVWTTFALAVAGLLLALLASAWTHPAVAAVCCVALPFALISACGHRVESRCDLSAARVAGFAACARALDKIHAVMLPGRGRLAWLHALENHPSREVRLATLRAAAPTAERASIEVDVRKAAVHARVRRVALAVRFGLLGAAVALGALPGYCGSATLLAAVPAAAPFTRLLALPLRDLWELWRLAYFSVAPVLVRLAGVLVMVVGLLTLVPSLARQGLPGLVAPTLATLAAAVVLLRGRRARRAAFQARLALAAGDGARALAQLAALRGRPAARPAVRRLRATALALGGDRAAAIAELRAALEHWPRHHAAGVELAALLAVAEPARALELVDRVERDVRGTATVAAMRCSLLRRLGRLAEAQSTLERLRSRPTHRGLACALEARIALAAGDLDAAARQLDEADRLEPGEATHGLIRAELALARGDAAGARAALAEAKRVAAHQRFAWSLHDDLQALESRLR